MKPELKDLLTRARVVVGVAVALGLGSCSTGAPPPVAAGGRSSVEVASCGMFPTLRPGDRLELAGNARDIGRGDIVAWRVAVPGEREPRQMVHRVVGLAGERLETGSEGGVLLNGTPLAEDYLTPGTRTDLKESVDIPPGHYFMLGDNRPYSSDSRVAGPVPASDIVARMTRVTHAKGAGDSDCPVADPSQADPASSQPLAVNDADPPRLQLVTLVAIVNTAVTRPVTAATFEALRTEVAKHTDHLEGVLGRVDPTEDDATDRVVRTEVLPALRAMTGATSVEQWVATRSELDPAMGHYLEAIRTGVLGN